ncbi:FkbM family methyltransferase [Sinorhizobium meliloti]|jgi:FkbM family methyltransferase|uniref:FkbM family methyltransferase n=1 Tax=Rhizobium meliloti TaxID=382 RepID=UPI0020BF7227|nr:FkbM family methyltransferase [Sinorhizobium meliloti]
MDSSIEKLAQAIEAQGREISELKNILRDIAGSANGIIHTLRHENRLLRTQLRVHALHNNVMEFWYEGEIIRFYVPDADTDLIQSDIVMWKTFFEKDFLEVIRKRYGLSGASILDAGANIGNHTVFFAKACGVENCISFEPNPHVADVLERNVRLNNLSSVTVMKEGLSDEEGFLYFSHQDMGNVGGTHFSHDKSGRGFKCRTIDSLALPKLDFIKIDVEGMGDKVLAGARETLSQHRPVVMIELFPGEVEPAAKILSEAGYTVAHQLNSDNFIYEHKP